MKNFVFGQKILHKFSVKRFSLQKQVMIIFSTLLLLVVFLLIPIIENNLHNIVDTEMYEMLQNSQGVFIDNGEEYISRIAEKQIYHLTYSNTTDRLGKITALTDDEAYDLLYNVFGEDLIRMVEQDKDVVESKVKYQDRTIYYRILQTQKDVYIISLAYEDYYNSLIGSLKKEVVYVIYLAIVIIAAILYGWVLTLIDPLKSIRNYINDIKEEKDTTLKIDRNDEIGVVSEALIEMKEQLDTQNKIKEEMIHNVSHDLKTPIALIQTYAQSIKDGIYPYGDKETSMNVIIENAERLEKKVHSLLYLNRLDYLRDKKPEHNVNMKTLIEHITLQMVTMHPQVVIELHLEDIFFMGNEEYWRICIENIIENAYRYVKHKIIITLKEDYLEIYNDGDFIEIEDTQSLFKPYEKGVKGQFGLGLSIVYKIVTMYDFVIKAENKDIGVSFTIRKK